MRKRNPEQLASVRWMEPFAFVLRSGSGLWISIYFVIPLHASAVIIITGLLSGQSTTESVVGGISFWLLIDLMLFHELMRIFQVTDFDFGRRRFDGFKLGRSWHRSQIQRVEILRAKEGTNRFSFPTMWVARKRGRGKLVGIPDHVSLSEVAQLFHLMGAEVQLSDWEPQTR